MDGVRSTGEGFGHRAALAVAAGDGGGGGGGCSGAGFGRFGFSSFFPPFDFATFLSHNLMSDFGGEECGGRRVSRRWCGIRSRVWTEVETTGARAAGFLTCLLLL